MEVANALLGGGYSARLNEEVRVKRGLSYGAFSNVDERRGTGLFIAVAQTKNVSAAEVAGLVDAEVSKLGSAPPSPQPSWTPARQGFHYRGARPFRAAKRSAWPPC